MLIKQKQKKIPTKCRSIVFYDVLLTTLYVNYYRHFSDIEVYVCSYLLLYLQHKTDIFIVHFCRYFYVR